MSSLPFTRWVPGGRGRLDTRVETCLMDDSVSAFHCVYGFLLFPLTLNEF